MGSGRSEFVLVIVTGLPDYRQREAYSETQGRSCGRNHQTFKNQTLQRRESNPRSQGYEPCEMTASPRCGKLVWLLTELIPGLPPKCFRYSIYGPDVKHQLMHCRASVVPSIEA